MLDAVPFDDAGVGGVGEDLRQALPADRPGRPAAGSAVGQPPVRELGGKALQGPVAGRVQVERGGDVGGAVGVGHDPGDLPPPDHLPGVGVAEGGGVREPALLGLLGHALADLAGEVGGVELGHQRVDAFHQPTRRRLLQVLGDADQRDAALAQQRADRDVVFHVPRQPVQLVDHDRVHVPVFGDAGEQGLEGGPVGGAGTFAAVGVLVGDAPAGIGDAPGARLPLGGDGEAFGAFAFLGLLSGGDPQVDHTPHRAHALRLVVDSPWTLDLERKASTSSPVSPFGRSVSRPTAPGVRGPG